MTTSTSSSFVIPSAPSQRSSVDTGTQIAGSSTIANSSSTATDLTATDRVETSTSNATTTTTPSTSTSPSSSSSQTSDGPLQYTSSISTISSATSTSLVTSASSIPASASSTATANHESPSWLSLPMFAGVAVGSFVVGALVAGLLVFALFKRRSKSSRSEPNMDQSRFSSSHDIAYIGEKGSAMMTMTTLVEPSFLPQQADDAEVKRRILSLTDHIDQHVENFYHTKKVHIDSNLETSIARYETRQMPNSLAACFEISTHPLALIKHCLAFHIFSRTIAPGEEIELILPTDIAGIVSVMYNKCLSLNTPRDTLSAFSLWKSLNGYLRTRGGSTRTSQTTSSAASSFANQFSTAFSAWSDAQYSDDHRNHHLAALIDDAIDNGVWLFQQPDNYRFSWNMLSYTGRNSTSKTIVRETVIVPSVFKMTHKGEPLTGQGQSIVHAVVKGF